MSKDPAFLFYSSDFLTGTMTMSNEQVGMYIRLLCLQHQKGKLSEEDMLYICSTYVKHVYDKFIKDEIGFYYNNRLQDEINKRVAYSESRRKNRTKGNNICLSYVQHMENENENENEDRNADENEKRKFKIPTIEEIQSYCYERKNSVDPESFFNFYESKGWMIGKNKMKSWHAAVRTWEKNTIKQQQRQYGRKELSKEDIDEMLSRRFPE